MLKKLSDVDTSVIDNLIEIKEESDRLDRFRQEAEERKDDVDEAVYRRVVDDYDQRSADLEEKAAPLKSEARQEYGKLRSIFEELDAELEEARADKEELEFRHAVGELDDEELEERLQEPQEILERCEEQRSEAEEVKARFLEAFESEEELTAEPDEPEPAEAEPEPTEPEPAEATVAAAPDEEAAATRLDEDAGATRLIDPDAAATRADAGAEPDAGPEDTVVLSAPEAGGPAEAEDAGAGADQTMVIPPGKLVVTEGSDSGNEFPLGAMSYVGRAPDNHIRFDESTVSRKHALIKAGSDGYSITDLDSSAGTFVNDDEISEERKLSDGDEIRIGDVELEFRSP